MDSKKDGDGGSVLAALIVTVTLWASAFPVIKTAGEAYGAGDLATLRFTIAAATLGSYAIYKQARRPRGVDIFWFFMTGLLGVAIYHPFLNYGEHKVSAGGASLLINSAPVWTAILAALLLREKIGWRKVVGIAVSFTGIVLISLGQKGGLSLEPAALFVVGSAICAAFYVIIQKRFLAKYTALEFTFWTVFAGVILLAPVFGWSTFQTAMKAPGRNTLEVAYLGVFPAAIAYMTFAYATVRLPASRVMSCMYFIPPLTMLMAWPYNDERPSGVSLIGGALALGGVAIVNMARKEITPVIAVEEA
jgi:drug/metabolite transporter (DMT)-like permease